MSIADVQPPSHGMAIRNADCSGYCEDRQGGQYVFLTHDILLIHVTFNCLLYHDIVTHDIARGRMGNSQSLLNRLSHELKRSGPFAPWGHIKKARSLRY